MQIKPEWRLIVRRAWSVRLAALAGVLSGAEAVIPMFSDAVPRGLFAALSIAVSMGAMVARVMVQRNME